MDFEWTPEEAAFRERLRACLAATLPDDWERFSQHGPARPRSPPMPATFCGKLAEDGLLTPHWPKEIGGAGARSVAPDDPGRGNVESRASRAAGST